MRILFLTNLYPGPERPWHGAFVANQAEALRRLGQTVDVLHIEGSRSRWEYVRGVVRLRRTLASSRFDLVHAHYGLTGLVGRCQRRVPLVVSMLGSDLLWAPQRVLSRAAGAAAEFNLVMSREMRTLLGMDHCCVLPNGTDLGIFRPLPPGEARARTGWSSREFVVVFPADPRRAVKDFPLAESAAAAARLRGASDLRLVPTFGRSQEDHNLQLNAADACLLTSRWEGSPNAVREALAVGLPVVSVPVGDAAELLDGIPWCAVRPRRAADLAGALLGLWHARRTQERPIRHDGRARVQLYSSDRVASHLARIYERVLAGERDGRKVQAEICPEYDLGIASGAGGLG